AEAAYPVSYTGDWRLIRVNNVDGYYMAISSTPGASVEITASASRAVIDFWDYEMYANPGSVDFELDGTSLGRFNLKGAVNANGKILDYQVTTGKTTASTIRMTLVTGSVVICGYVLVFPDTRFSK
ncbi:MAG TPA: hypothetical protein PKM25_02575, partial [Candidatus Ozemobacteraceae bacterium]|nr:hypothetical protein [Candidatus Ozemobacteraceae bacterium]